MSMISLAILALVLTGVLCFLMAHFFISMLRKFAQHQDDTRKPIAPPRIVARAAQGGEGAIKALQAMSGGRSREHLRINS